MIARRLIEIAPRVLLKNLRNTYETHNVPTKEPYGVRGATPLEYAKESLNYKRENSVLTLRELNSIFAGFPFLQQFWMHLADYEADLENFLTLIFLRPERLVDACHVFHFSGDPQLVLMKCCLFGSFRSIFT